LPWEEYFIHIMTEDKKEIKSAEKAEEIKKETVQPEVKVAEPAFAKATADKPVLAAENSFEDIEDDNAGLEKKGGDMVEELPDDIKKKLEARKEEKSAKKPMKKKKKRAKVRVEIGKIYIKASYNNTIVSATDLNGNVIAWASAGMAGFKGPKKATSYASQIITKIVLMKAKEEYGLREASVFIKGIGTGREAAVRAVNANGINVTSIKDITPLPHNGCRPKKPRRV
jgi:small subunit ribosomal protein S11